MVLVATVKEVVITVAGVEVPDVLVVRVVVVSNNVQHSVLYFLYEDITKCVMGLISWPFTIHLFKDKFVHHQFIGNIAPSSAVSMVTFSFSFTQSSVILQLDFFFFFYITFVIIFIMTSSDRSGLLIMLIRCNKIFKKWSRHTPRATVI